ncbi:SDR family oxidoreductase [Chitinophaga horti]|uniref:SDR family oxidoreductase n=1 Tax=Chitinophaga horti TaxID=2920382 RepID=A0ABY6J092_9BACT|nr:SDR family oxidoreductase [Chitinophaga horti]UYQ92062.1 SDR family oxidoreductase [Chitinophaga horti]
MYFSNKIVLITGASSGIGKALALELAKQQAKLILTARRAEVLAEVQEECLQYTQHCKLLSFDLTDSAQIAPKAAEALQLFGGLDVLINNAGVSQRSPVTDTAPEVDRQIMEINFFSAVNLTKALLPHFVKQGHGHIIVMSSMAGLMGFPLRSAYSAAKHALHGFFETFQTEQPVKDLHTLIVCPGRINTPISLSALTGSGQQHGKMDDGQKNGIPADKCAQIILRAAEKKKKLIKIAKEEKILLAIKRVLPSLYYRIAHKAGMKP